MQIQKNSIHNNWMQCIGYNLDDVTIYSEEENLKTASYN